MLEQETKQFEGILENNRPVQTFFMSIAPLRILFALTLSATVVLVIIFGVMHFYIRKQTIKLNRESIETDKPLLVIENSSPTESEETLRKDAADLRQEQKDELATIKKVRMGLGILAVLFLVLSILLAIYYMVNLGEITDSSPKTVLSRAARALERKEFEPVTFQGVINDTKECVLTRGSVICVLKDRLGKTVSFPAHRFLLKTIEEGIKDPELVRKIRRHPNYWGK